MSHDEAREEKAFEALIADAFHKINGEEICGHNTREPDEDEREILELLGKDFIERLLEEKSVDEEQASDVGGELAMAGDAMGGSLFRCDGVDESIEAELDKADREIIERKKREQNGEAS